MRRLFARAIISLLPKKSISALQLCPVFPSTARHVASQPVISEDSSKASRDTRAQQLPTDRSKVRRRPNRRRPIRPAAANERVHSPVLIIKREFLHPVRLSRAQQQKQARSTRSSSPPARDPWFSAKRRGACCPIDRQSPIPRASLLLTRSPFRSPLPQVVLVAAGGFALCWSSSSLHRRRCDGFLRDERPQEYVRDSALSSCDPTALLCSNPLLLSALLATCGRPFGAVWGDRAPRVCFSFPRGSLVVRFCGRRRRRAVASPSRVVYGWCSGESGRDCSSA